jgi:hypothetical protein
MRDQARAPLAWVATDEDGEIEAMSSAAGELFALNAAGARGQNLFLFFPTSVRAMAIDAEHASIGWPNDRTVTLEPLSRRSLSVHYRVSASLGGGAARLNWFFDVDPAAAPQVH